MKNLNPTDFSRSDFVTHRKFILAHDSEYLSVNQVHETPGTFYIETAPTTPGGFYKGPFFSSVRQQFYTTEYKTETVQLIHNSASIIQIDPRLFDEKIKQDSLIIRDSATNATFLDDAYGNIYHSGSNAHVGNIFYEFGTIVITDTGSYQTIASSNFEVEFRAQHTKTELNFQATIQPSEFNFSSNPTATINGKTELVRPQYTYSVSDFSASYGETITSHSIIPEFFGLAPSGSLADVLTPHITTIGFYNDRNELLVLGKLAAPTPIPREFPITFRMRIDI